MKKVLVCGKSNGSIKYVISQDGEPFCEGSFSVLEFNSGDVFKGIVREHLSQTKSYFVDIGDERTAYLESENFKTGESGLFQIKVPGHDNKGAVITEEISFAGIYSVVTFIPNNKAEKSDIAFSSKITSMELVSAVTKDLEDKNLLVPIENYFIKIMVRTSVCLETKDRFFREVLMFRERFTEILNKFTVSTKIEELFKTPFCEYLLCKYRRFDYTRVITDDSLLEAEIKGFTKLISNEIQVERKNGHFSIFDIDEGASKVKRYTGHKVMLNSGAWITVDKTEAMYVFDVNSGSSKHSTLEINKEAADAIVRVTTLRDLSGIIMCDFINMKTKEENDSLTDYLRELFSNDYSFVKVYGMTKLGIMEIGRRRT